MEDIISLGDHLVLVSWCDLVIVGPRYILCNTRKTRCSNKSACENQVMQFD